MDIERLYEILAKTTVQLRKGEELEGTPELVEAVKAMGPDDKLDDLPGGILEVYAMPHESEAPDNLVKVDCHFITIGVDRKKAEQHRDELVRILADYPNPEELAGGPSYIAVGGAIGDQGAAFQLFALGEALGLWKVITPKRLGIEGPEAQAMAGMGFVMMSGFAQPQPPA
jgi:hypothetical protein